MSSGPIETKKYFEAKLSMAFWCCGLLCFVHCILSFLDLASTFKNEHGTRVWIEVCLRLAFLPAFSVVILCCINFQQKYMSENVLLYQPNTPLLKKDLSVKRQKAFDFMQKIITCAWLVHLLTLLVFYGLREWIWFAYPYGVTNMSLILVFAFSGLDKLHVNIVFFVTAPTHHILSMVMCPDLLVVADVPVNAVIHAVTYKLGIVYYNATLQLHSVIRAKVDTLRREKFRVNLLIEQMLPPYITSLLREKKVVKATHFDSVSVLFSSIANFSELCAMSSQRNIILLLDTLSTLMEGVVDSCGGWKIENVEQTFLCIAGAPSANAHHVMTMLRILFGFVHAYAALPNALAARASSADQRAHLRLLARRTAAKIGLHSGPCSAGIISSSILQYSVTSEILNYAARLCATCPLGSIHVSHNTVRTLLQQEQPHLCMFDGPDQVRPLRDCDPTALPPAFSLSLGSNVIYFQKRDSSTFLKGIGNQDTYVMFCAPPPSSSLAKAASFTTTSPSLSPAHTASTVSLSGVKMSAEAPWPSVLSPGLGCGADSAEGDDLSSSDSFLRMDTALASHFSLITQGHFLRLMHTRFFTEQTDLNSSNLSSNLTHPHSPSLDPAAGGDSPSSVPSALPFSPSRPVAETPLPNSPPQSHFLNPSSVLVTDTVWDDQEPDPHYTRSAPQILSQPTLLNPRQSLSDIPLATSPRDNSRYVFMQKPLSYSAITHSSFLSQNASSLPGRSRDASSASALERNGCTSVLEEGEDDLAQFENPFDALPSPSAPAKGGPSAGEDDPSSPAQTAKTAAFSSRFFHRFQGRFAGLERDYLKERLLLSFPPMRTSLALATGAMAFTAFMLQVSITPFAFCAMMFYYGGMMCFVIRAIIAHYTKHGISNPLRPIYHLTLALLATSVFIPLATLGAWVVDEKDFDYLLTPSVMLYGFNSIVTLLPSHLSFGLNASNAVLSCVFCYFFYYGGMTATLLLKRATVMFFVAAGFYIVSAFEDNLHRRAYLLARLVEDETVMSRELLDAMLPHHVVPRLLSLTPGALIFDSFPHLAYLHTDIVTFTDICQMISPGKIMVMLSSIFSAFDDHLADHSITKLYTIGDAYCCAALPSLSSDQKSSPSSSPTSTPPFLSSSLSSQQLPILKPSLLASPASAPTLPVVPHIPLPLANSRSMATAPPHSPAPDSTPLRTREKHEEEEESEALARIRSSCSGSDEEEEKGSGAQLKTLVSRLLFFAATILAELKEVNEGFEKLGIPNVQMRFGIGAGPAFGGMIGALRPKYLLYGKAVTHGQLMEKTGIPNTIQLCPVSAAAVVDNDSFTLTIRPNPPALITDKQWVTYQLVRVVQSVVADETLTSAHSRVSTVSGPVTDRALLTSRSSLSEYPHPTHGSRQVKAITRVFGAHMDYGNVRDHPQTNHPLPGAAAAAAQGPSARLQSARDPPPPLSSSSLPTLPSQSASQSQLSEKYPSASASGAITDIIEEAEA